MLFLPSSCERTQEIALTVSCYLCEESLCLKFTPRKVLALALLDGDSAYYRKFCGRVGCWEEHFARSCTLPTKGDSHALELNYIYKACGLSHC